MLPVDFLQEFINLPHERLNEKLQSIFANPYLQEAIYIASPELFQEFNKWRTGANGGLKDANKLALALYRYLLRMCTRCTPYGLFAGCATGEISDKTQVRLAHHEKHKRRCRLDMNYVAELAGAIGQVPAVRSRLKYFPNNSLYGMAGKYRYAEYVVKNKFRTYHLSEIEGSEYINKILRLAHDGATIDELSDAIIEHDVSKEEALGFVAELVQSQVLVSELEPTITGEEFFHVLINKLNDIGCGGAVLSKLKQINTLLQDTSAGVDKYSKLHDIVKQILPGTTNKDLVQTDLFLSTESNSISKSVTNEIVKQVEKLWVMSKKHSNGNLKNFCSAFTERYDTQEVPLMIALDAESGIGYAGVNGNACYTPLVDEININLANGSTTIPWSKMQQFQLRKLYSCLKEGSKEIEITDKDLDELKESDSPSIPISAYIMGSLLGNSADEIDEGNYMFEFKSCGGPSAAMLLGRFCHGDHLLSNKVKECLSEEAESYPNAILAEIVHLPEARTGNVLMRPQLRGYEIVYLGNGSVQSQHQIPLSDLMVSVRDDTVILRSRKLNKQIIPRLSTAHNFGSGSLAPYNFLCDLQFQHLNSSFSWDWGVLTDQPFLPRVRYRNIILSRCTWFLRKSDYPELTKVNTVTDIAYSDFFKRIRQQLDLPQTVVIVESDNELFIDMNNESSLQILGNALVKNRSVVMQEFLGSAENCFVKGEQGRHTNEIIIPCRNMAHVQQKMNTSQKHMNGEFVNHSGIAGKQVKIPERRFTAGSEWLYLKIYCGINSSEKVLKEVIKPLTERLILNDKLDKWFFIRYADPDNHLRVRFYNNSDRDFWKTVLDELNAAIKKHSHKDLIYKIQVDTYEKEIERYGANTMELSEEVFYFDSEAVANCVDLFDQDSGEKYRWLLAARGVDMLLSDFGHNLQSKANLLKALQASFHAEFGGTKAIGTQLNDAYREHMHLLKSFLDERNDFDNEIEEAISVFKIRSIKLEDCVLKIKHHLEKDQSGPSVDDLIRSYIHMFLNRMFLCNQRKHELVLYHYLAKYYESQIAMSKHQLQTA